MSTAPSREPGARARLATARQVALATMRSPLAQGGTLLVLANTLLNVSNFGFHIAVTRLMGPTRYGELSALLNAVTVLALPLAAIEAAVAQIVAVSTERGTKPELRRVIRWSVPAVGGGTLLWLAVSPVAEHALRLPSLLPVALLAVWVGLMTLGAVLQGALLGERRYGAVAVVVLAGAVIRLGVGIGLTAAGLGVDGAMLGTVLSAVAMLGTLLWMVRGQLGKGDSGPVIRSRDVLRSASAIGGITVLISVDTWLARHFLPSRSAGIYAAASTLAKIPMFLPAAVGLVAFPRLASERGRGAEARKHLASTLGITLALSALGALILAVLGRPLIDVFFGDRYGAASGSLRVLAVADAAAAMSALLVYFFMARRSRVAYAAWPGSLLAFALAISLHGNDQQLAGDMLIANLGTLGVLAGAAAGVLARDLGGDFDPAGWLRGRGSLRAAVIALGGIGAVATLAVGILGGSGAVDHAAGVAVATLTIAVLAGVIREIRLRGAPATVTTRERVADVAASPVAWAIAVGLVAALAAQSWFAGSSAIAGGDDAPPQGLAWITHMFAPWAWSGSNLGGPNATSVELPWGLCLEIVHHLGGSEVLAQRLWFTALFTAAGVAAFALLRLLRLGPVAAAVGALAYLFNPYTMSTVNNNPVFLAAMAMLPALAWCVLATGLGRISVRAGVLLIVLSAPMVGYVYSNPPLVLLLIVGAVVAIVAAVIIDGRPAFLRCRRLALIASPALLALSAYWLVPSIIQAGVASGALGNTGSWTWTESRATLANGLWLNTIWSWHYIYYYPYANAYREFPLQALVFVLPAGAFSALPLAYSRRTSLDPTRRRLILLAAAVALFAIVLSTGTRAPGDVIFNRLYALPYGWLLREPGRFLMGAALAYAVLAGFAVQMSGELLRGVARRIPAMLPATVARAGAAGTLASVAVLLPVYPLLLGQEVPDKRPHSTLPGMHVHFPSYWKDMASYVNHRTGPGATFVLPPDPNYQMPYKWGYYGTDAFISQLISSHVLYPISGVYYPGSQELLSADNHLAADLLAGRFAAANGLLNAVGASTVLVRKDINLAGTPQYVASPARLAAALAKDPDARLVHAAGPLELYEVGGATVPSTIVTDRATQPNLEALPLLSPGSAFVRHAPISGTANMVEAPPISDWSTVNGRLSTTLSVVPGRQYKVYSVPAWNRAQPPIGLGRKTPFDVSVSGAKATISTPVGRNLVSDGDFSQGPWLGGVADCANGHLGGSDLSAELLPNAAPGRLNALRLSASADSACEFTGVARTTHSVVATLYVRHLSGAQPRFCLWERPQDICAPGSGTIETTSHAWQHVRVVLHPLATVKSIGLFVYSDAIKGHGRTVNDFADTSVRTLVNPNWVPVLISSTGGAAKPVHLVASRDSISNRLSGPSGDAAIDVDGLRQGWIGPSAQRTIHYTATAKVRASQLLSILVVAAMLLSGAVALARRRWPALRWRPGSGAGGEHDR